MLYGGAAAVVLGGGALAYTVLGGPGGGPAGTVEQFYAALDSGNTEEAENLVHSDAPMAGSIGTISDTIEQADISVESTEVLERNENSARVRATISVSMMGQSQTEEETINLRKEDGEWKIYSSGSGLG